VAHKPLSCHLRQWYALFYLYSRGRAAEARQQMERVLEEDPLSQMWHYILGYVLLGLELDAEAAAALQRSVELDPHFWFGYVALGMLHAKLGQHVEARKCADRGFAAAPWSPHSIGLLAGTMMNAGETKEAEELLAKLSGSYREPAARACFHVVHGEIDNAVEWAGKALDQRVAAIITIIIRSFEPLLRKSAGWPGLLKKMNLGE